MVCWYTHPVAVRAQHEGEGVRHAQQLAKVDPGAGVVQAPLVHGADRRLHRALHTLTSVDITSAVMHRCRL